ncbi:putative metal-binding motif-containing protein [Thermodesulfobacteriota bacterium]
MSTCFRVTIPALSVFILFASCDSDSPIKNGESSLGLDVDWSEVFEPGRPTQAGSVRREPTGPGSLCYYIDDIHITVGDTSYGPYDCSSSSATIGGIPLGAYRVSVEAACGDSLILFSGVNDYVEIREGANKCVIAMFPRDTWRDDWDGDGFHDCDCSQCDCDDNNQLTYPGAIESCDGEINDCNNAVINEDENDNDADRYVVCEPWSGTGAFIIGGGDCDDANPEINPGVDEPGEGLCDDGFDQNCDGSDCITLCIDNDSDGYGNPASPNCAFPENDCDDDNSITYPGAVEHCDGQDNNCDSGIPPDEADLDGDGWMTCGGDCDDGNLITYPNAPERCDGVDNDCDDLVPDDESDDDGDGWMVCEGDCDDTEPEASPANVENRVVDNCDDGLDNDCDDFIDADDFECVLIGIPISTCSGEGMFYAYQGDPFQDIDVMFPTDYDQLVIFARGDYIESLDVEVNSNPISLDLVVDNLHPFHVSIYSLQTAAGDVISIVGESQEQLGARAIQGYLAQDAAIPAIDTETIQIIYDSGISPTAMLLTEGTYSYLILDKYSVDNSGQPDNTYTTITVEGSSGIIYQETYTAPWPTPSEGVVVGEYEIVNTDEYTFAIDTNDSLYWPYIQCAGP